MEYDTDKYKYNTFKNYVKSWNIIHHGAKIYEG